jgi:hypothetical protein
MNSTTSSLFEAEMRNQIASAEAGVLESLTTGDPILIESARGHLDGLVNLAHRNGLSIPTLIPAEPDISIEPVVDVREIADPPIDLLEQPAAS